MSTCMVCGAIRFNNQDPRLIGYLRGEPVYDNDCIMLLKALTAVMEQQLKENPMLWHTIKKNPEEDLSK